MTIAKLVRLKRPPLDLPDVLRELADLAAEERLTDLIVAYVVDDEFIFKFATSKNFSLTLSSMLHAECLSRMSES